MRRHTLAPPERKPREGQVYRKEKEESQGTPPLPSPPFREGGGEGVTPGVVSEIKKLTATLNPSQRATLLAELSLQATQSDNGSIRDLDMWSQSVYAALVGANGGLAGGVPGPAVVKRSLASSGTWSIVRGFMSDSKLDLLKVTERQSVYDMLAQMVVKNAVYVSRKSGAPLSPKLVANCSTNVASLFEQSFPGYVRSGLAHIVARRLTAPPQEE